MFNLQGSELMIILLLALVVLGPEKLPEAMRKLGQFYAQVKKMSSSFQQEFKAAVDEPMREVRETANMLRDSADFRKLADGQRTEKPKSAEMASPAPATEIAADAAATAEMPVEAPAETPAATRDPFGGASSASPRPRNGTASSDALREAPLIASPKPPAGPVVVGAPPVPATSAAPPPPPPPGATPTAHPDGAGLPPLAEGAESTEGAE